MHAPLSFEQRCFAVFTKQYQHNALYQAYCNGLKKNPSTIHSYLDIPFLPISLFKHHIIKTSDWTTEKTFLSSGTTQEKRAQHHVASLKHYEHSFKACFDYFYGDHRQYSFLCLLPSYVEREGSSLVYMADYFIRHSQQTKSNFYKHGDALKRVIEHHIAQGIPTILLGVTFALIDFALDFNIDFKDLIVMETGGMKGRKKEMLREEVHGILCRQWHIAHVHSEYGMTELMSQAYSQGEGYFIPPTNAMKVLVRPVDNPTISYKSGKGGLNIIDLNNEHSCAFIATEDVGEVDEQGGFKVLGRMSHAEIRGCHQLMDNNIEGA